MTGQLYITLGILMERSGSQSRSGSTAKGYVTKAKNYIAHNYTLGIGVENATDFVGVSRATLYRAFMEYEGLSPAQYITDFRVNAACRLLEETELPVSAVARSVGYNDSLYFQGYSTRQRVCHLRNTGLTLCVQKVKTRRFRLTRVYK